MEHYRYLSALACTSAMEWRPKGQQDPGYSPSHPQLSQQLAPGWILGADEKAEENTQAKSWFNYTEFTSKFWQSSLFQPLLTYHNPHYTKCIEGTMNYSP